MTRLEFARQRMVEQIRGYRKRTLLIAAADFLTSHLGPPYNLHEFTAERFLLSKEAGIELIGIHCERKAEI